jgi:hypothetical protein
MNAKMLTLLLAGEYLCPVRYRDEYEALANSTERAEQVDRWLAGLDRRLARLGGDGNEGAFFMAPANLEDKDVARRVRDELRNFRDVYGPAVRLLDFIRQAKAESAMCSVGERIQLAELESLVLASASLTTLLTSLIEVIYNGNARNSVRENLSKLLEHLAKDGYVMLADKSSGTYQITGKIEQLYTAMRFLDDNQAIDQAEVDDQLDLLDAKSADQVQQADQDDSVGAKAGNIDRDEDGSEVG